MAEVHAGSRDCGNLLAAAGAEFDALLRVCAGLTAPAPLESMLDALLTDARQMVRAEAGTLYVINNRRLRFICSQNDARPDACAIADSSRERPWARLKDRWLPLDPTSLAGYVATTGKPLCIGDAYRIDDDAPYGFDAAHDQAIRYRTRSVLAVPLRVRSGAVLGVLQMINRVCDGADVIEFDERDRRILSSLASVAAVTLRNAQLHEELYRSHTDTILRLATAAEFRDAETGDHIRRMSCYCEAIARRMRRGHEWEQRILLASPMHDVGKLGLPDAILSKPGPLTDEERRVVQRHTTIGSKILADGESELLRMAQRIAHHHHEHWDGGGYPEGRSGESIPLEARITAVADVFDALTNKRVYKPAYSTERSLDMIRDQRGAHFDPEVIDNFLAVEDDVRAIQEAYAESVTN